MKVSVYKYDGKLWTLKKLADFVDEDPTYIRYKRELRGKPLRFVGYGQKHDVFDVLGEGKVLFTGSDEEIGKQFGYQPKTVRAAYNTNHPLGGFWKNYRLKKVATACYFEGKVVDYYD